MTDLEVVPDRDGDGEIDQPKAKREWVEGLIRDAGYTDKLALVGRRGYFHDIGKSKTENDLGIYDDAIFLVTPTVFLAFNANTDPSKGVTGRAVLRVGRWLYCRGTHNITKEVSRRYPALVQAQAVSILRVGARNPEYGFFGINIHKGGLHGTSSEGCQTIYPTQWDDFLVNVSDAMAAAQTKTIPYILTAYRA